MLGLTDSCVPMSCLGLRFAKNPLRNIISEV
jgi:hypothetical protein